MKDIDIIQPVLGLIIIGGLIAVICCLFFYTPPAESKEIILVLIGVLSKSASDVINYYFGATSTGKIKDKTISDIASGTGSGIAKP